MADNDVHSSQAEHNEILAKELIDKNLFHDWGITVAFYAAVHYIEAWFFKKYGRYTETSIRVDRSGSLTTGHHSWREHQIQIQGFPKELLISYRMLRSNSQIARYLSAGDGPIVDSDNKPVTAFTFFKPQEARKIVNNLKTIKKLLK